MRTICWVLLVLLLTVLGVAGYTGYYVFGKYTTLRSAAARVVKLELENRQLQSDMLKYEEKTKEQQQALDLAVQKAEKVRIVYKDRIRVVKERNLGVACEDVIANAIKYKNDLRWE